MPTFNQQNQNVTGNQYNSTNDPRLSDDFESALKALIEHHKADPLTALAAVMERHLLVFEHEELSILSNAEQVFYCDEGPTTADDIKPESNQ